jgi:delta 1-pyrroline-5-carboxylate dehydrogenase
VRAREIADAVIAMIKVLRSELVLGDPALLATDVGPVIDSEAFDGIQRQLQRLRRECKSELLGDTQNPIKKCRAISTGE